MNTPENKNPKYEEITYSTGGFYLEGFYSLDDLEKILVQLKAISTKAPKASMRKK